MKFNKLIMLFLLACLAFLISCPKDEKEMLVRTGSVTEITITTAKVSGEILDLGEGATNYGHCYSINPNPTIAGTKTEMENPVLGKYTSTLTGLSASTTYYVRAYLSRGKEVVYGVDSIFTTALNTPPSIVTTTITEITTNSAISGGTITSEGGTPVTACGVCWNISENPTIFDYKTINDKGTGSFISNITGINPGITYNVRAYATNEGGTGYGNTESFTTDEEWEVPTVITEEISILSNNLATCGGNITNDGGKVVTERGICWSTGQTPTINDNKKVSGDGSGSFSCTISGLSEVTTYYYCAYATNSVGTGYGSIISFTTKLADIEGNLFNSVKIGSQVWMKENLKTILYNDGKNNYIPLVIDITTWANLTTPAYCWYNNDKSTYKDTYGALYNWWAVSTGRLCPVGWHVPTEAEWHQLVLFLDPNAILVDVNSSDLTESAIAGGKMKEIGTTHWSDPNIGATNELGFTALPGGLCYIFGNFTEDGTIGAFWTVTEIDNSVAWARMIYNNWSSIFSYYNPKTLGQSVRCLKD